MQEINRDALADYERLLNMSDRPLYAPLRTDDEIKPMPFGLDQQGRHRTRQRPDFCDTYPTGPAPLDGAHAATDVGADDDTPRPPLTPGEALFLCAIGLLSAMFVIGLAGYVVGKLA